MLIIFLLILNLGIANNFKNMPITLNQPDGTTINCLISGDEFYQRLHDENNYTIIQNIKDGYYYYAIEDNDKISTTHHKYGNINPEDIGIPKNIGISKEEYLSIRNKYFRDVETRDAPSIGTINNLNVFIRFADEGEFVTPRTVYDIPFNDPEGPSMYHYFHEVSYELLTVNTHHYPACDINTNLSYQDQYPRAYYKPYNENSNPDGYENDNQARMREHTMLKNAMEFVANDIPDDLDIDSNDDGYIDNVTFLVSGSPTGWSDLLWPHRWALYTYDVYINGSRVYDYNLNLDQGGYFTVGTLCHEFFHSLGAPDLYHYYDDVAPVAVGGWDVMDASSDIPQSMSAFMKYQYTEWITSMNEVEYGGVYQINPLSSNENNIYKINSPLSDDEYFVLEYRVKEGLYEVNTPGDDNGLLIYRVNTNYNGNANGPPDGLYLYRYGGTPESSGSFGAAVFSQETQRTKFNDTTNPSCFLTDGSNGGINISYVGEDLETIEFAITNLILVPQIDGLVYDTDEDGNINPGEEIIINFSLANLSDGINASNITTTLYSDNDILIQNPVNNYNEFLEDGEIIYQSYTININDDIPLGDIHLGIDITASYIENGQPLDFQNQSDFSINVNLMQEGFPFFTSSQISGAPTVADLNKDGENEIYFADFTGVIRALDPWGNELTTGIFPFDTGSQIWGTAAVADINNDGIDEIVFGSKSKKLYAFTYTSLLFEYDADSFLIGTPAIGNIDSDSELEIVAGGFSGSNKKLYVVNHDGTDVANFPLDVGEKIKKGAALADFNENGLDDIVFGTENDHVYLILDDGTIAPGFPFEGDDAFRTAPIIINHNGIDFIVIGSEEGTLYGLHPDGTLKFEFHTNYPITTSPSIYKKDEYLYIIFGNSNGDIYALDMNGNQNTAFLISTGYSISSSILFADLNNDTLDEIIVLDEGGFLNVLNSDLTPFNNTPIEYDFEFSSAPTISDIDQDGDLEVLAGTVNALYVIDFKDLSFINESWNIFRGNHRRNGLFVGNSCIPGDLNYDGEYNILDITLLINQIFNDNTQLECSGDIDGNGVVDIVDIISLINLILD